MAIASCCSRRVFWLAVVALLLVCMATAAAQATTDPSEVEALNAVLGQWGLHAASSWNISGEPCSGAAIDGTDLEGDSNLNPGIKCDCSYNNNTICHIIKLRVYAQSVDGQIPQKMQNLVYLTDLTLDKNLLTGPLPAFFGNFSEMQYMSVSINALSGPLPKEIGRLKKLKVLRIGTNNFSGPLPVELGNLINLEKLYMDSSGISGELPSTMVKLANMKILWASDNNLTGNIPEYIGSWRNLTDLRLEGNTFQGPVSSSFSNLTNLVDLRVSDLVGGGSSSLDFISKMTSLTKLILRKSIISGQLPSFSGFQKLKQLDLTFNNISGTVPQSLFNLNSLKFLFLGNNSLSGSLPEQKSTSLNTIDLSYNFLSGNFPSWANTTNLALNLVGNKFVIDNSSSSTLPSGLNCLQRDTPCFRNSPISYSFGINCGGNRPVMGSDGIVYDADSSMNGAASYYVSSTRRWGVSNVGLYLDSPENQSYVLTISKQFPNTLDMELFQTARTSPSSLRYYGIGLQNGNYTIKLHFAEITSIAESSWHKLRRRVFDIYIQGTQVEKDFDIIKAAGGAFQSVVREHPVLVTNNFLEVHFFWAGKGTCCVPSEGSFGPSISAISVSRTDFIPMVRNERQNKSGLKKLHIMVIALGGLAIAMTFVMILFLKRRKTMREYADLSGIVAGPNIFSYNELRSATENFSTNNLLGQGGYGQVYKGKLADGRLVAVKQLSVTSHQGKQEFTTEISTISSVQHRNLVKLYGCCVELDKPLLVYEFLENGSLDLAFFGKGGLDLNWETRFNIFLGVARGLAYLHEESSVCIIHRDIKAANILLDGELKPKISDFGLAKLYDDNKSHISTRIAGTTGYLAPEYVMRGHLTEKTDVFAFGVLSMELLCGHPNKYFDDEGKEIDLLEWVWFLYEEGRPLELLDSRLKSYNQEEAIRVLKVALMCTQAGLHRRPPMSRVVSMIAGDVEVTDHRRGRVICHNGKTGSRTLTFSN